ncbi:MAG: hypothetical protein NT003_00760 [Candidatus Magasanikbacteria bacterium]|nr:hypothetical protein [Candidatus Magasanikbacteria bacterium]
MTYFIQFFTLDYWFGFPPLITTPWLVILLVKYVALFFGGIAALMFYPKIEDRFTRQVTRRAGSGAIWLGVCGLFLTFSRFERVPVFMYRYWFLFIAIAFVVWLVRLYKYAVQRREKLDEETRTYQTKEKYLRK